MAGIADTSKFIIPEDNYGGLYKIADQLERQKRYDYEQHKDELNRRRLNSSFINNSLDPKDYFTGTYYDPVITGMINDAKKQAFDLSAKGASADDIQLAIMPTVDKLNSYYTTAKSINKQISDQLQNIPANSGYLKDKLRQKALQSAFVGEDGQLVDPRTIDPQKDFLSMAAQKYPMEVTDLSGLTSYLNQIPRVTSKVKAKTYNSKGGFTMKDLEVTGPTWTQLDTDERGNNIRKLVPNYQLATDDENPIVGADGKSVRLLDKNVFHDVMSKSHSYADRLRGEVQQAIDSGELKNPDGSKIGIDSPQAINAARALMYQDLRDLTPTGVVDAVATNPQAISFTLKQMGGGKSGSGGGELTLNDVYPRIVSAMNDPQNSINFKGKRIGTTMNGLDSEAQRLIFDAFGGRKDDLNETNTFLADKNGVPTLYRTNGEGQPEINKKFEVGAIPKTIDVKAQVGASEKRERLEQIKNSPYTEIQERGISNFMNKNGLTRKKAIEILKANGRL